MCGSSAPKSYGSLGSSCAMNPPRRSDEEGIVHQNSQLPTSNSQATRCRDAELLGNWELGIGSGLANRQHPIEGDLRPLLLIVGDDDLIVDAAFDQLFENPEQMVRRHA